MAQQLADNWQAKSTTSAEACIGVAKIMKAAAVEPGTPRYSLPRTFQIGARLLGVVARHDVRAEPIEPGEDRKGRSIKDHGLLASLGVGEEQQPAFQVHLFPFEVQDFPEPTAGEQQQPNRCGGEGTDLGEAVLSLGQVLGLRLSLVHVPGNALGLRFTDGRAQSLQLSTSQETLAAVLLELLDPARRVHTLGHNAGSAGKSVHAADDRQNPVGLEWRPLERPVQPRDLRPGELVSLGRSEFGLYDLVQQMPIENSRSGF